ncbi:Ig-like domain-containing protein [Octadecabacter antarcticus]|nr:Ig-like domain-containing protein [Octadecabacter antarcticus]
MPPPDTTAPTVTLTGPSEIVTGAFDVSAAFSEPVTGLMASEITVEGGSVTGLSGDDADYTITIEPVMGATVTVTIIANAAQDEANNGNIVSNTYTIQAGSPASAFEENEEEILAVVAAEALRGVRSTVSSNVRMTSAAQERFISGRQQAGTDSQMVSRAATPLDITGSAELSNGRFSTQGTFFGETGSDESGQTRLFFGDFDIQRDTDGSVSAQINGKLAWERQISNTAMYGYYLGAELGRATLEGAFAGEQDSFGASVGAYFVTEIQPNLYVDGFASLGVGRNSLELDNGTLNVASDYKTTTGTVGASLTGVVEGDGYELWPQLQLTYGQTHIGKMTFSGEAYSLVDDTLSLDAGTVSMASGTFTAEFKVPLDGLSVSDSHALFTFAPRVICERIMATDTTSNCGGGAEIGMVSRSSDGLSNLTVNIRRDRVGDTTTTGLGLNFERAF